MVTEQLNNCRIVPMTPRNPSFLVFILSLSLMLPGCAGGAPPQGDFAESWRGEQPPLFELELLDGSSFKLKRHLGEQIIVINFFGSWCPPCRAEMPTLQQFYQRHRKRITMIGISLNEKEKAAEQFMHEVGATFPAGLDRAPDANPISKQYGVPTPPTTVVIGRSGRIKYYRPGMLQPHDFRYLNRLVNKSGSGASP